MAVTTMFGEPEAMYVRVDGPGSKWVSQGPSVVAFRARAPEAFGFSPLISWTTWASQYLASTCPNIISQGNYCQHLFISIFGSSWDKLDRYQYQVVIQVVGMRSLHCRSGGWVIGPL
jgi:hypothetical protein